MGNRPRTEPEGHVRVGQIVGPFGTKGGLKILLLTDFPERFQVGSLLYLRGTPRQVLELHWHRGQARVSLEGCASVEEAEALKWEYLTVPATDRPNLDDGEYLASELVGLKVVEGGRSLGTVGSVVHAPAHDLLEVGGVLIPLVSEFVKSVDLDSGKIEVELIEGMRPGEQAEEVR
jgi:16S rRNA processing protein RimM